MTWWPELGKRRGGGGKLYSPSLSPSTSSVSSLNHSSRLLDNWSGWLWSAAVLAFSLVLGGVAHCFNDIKSNILYFLLTFVTLTLPLVVAFFKTSLNWGLYLGAQWRSQSGRRRRAISMISGKSNNNNYRFPTFPPTSPISQPTPSSFLTSTSSYTSEQYVCFLYFLLILVIAITAAHVAEFVAHRYVTTVLPTASNLDGIIYTNGMMAAIYICDWIVEWIIDVKITPSPVMSLSNYSPTTSSPPLIYIFRLYFYMLYFVLYRNVFARLRFAQFLFIQASSSLLVVCMYPLQMAQTTHSLLARWFGINPDYEVYIRRIGRSFFIRNIAENATMLGFLAWCSILHFGNNAQVYPFFKFVDIDTDPSALIIDQLQQEFAAASYSYQTTIIYSVSAFAFELVTGFITRKIMLRRFGISITREAVAEFERHPYIVVSMVNEKLERWWVNFNPFS